MDKDQKGTGQYADTVQKAGSEKSGPKAEAGSQKAGNRRQQDKHSGGDDRQRRTEKSGKKHGAERPGKTAEQQQEPNGQPRGRQASQAGRGEQNADEAAGRPPRVGRKDTKDSSIVRGEEGSTNGEATPPDRQQQRGGAGREAAGARAPTGSPATRRGQTDAERDSGDRGTHGPRPRSKRQRSGKQYERRGRGANHGNNEPQTRRGWEGTVQVKEAAEHERQGARERATRPRKKGAQKGPGRTTSKRGGLAMFRDHRQEKGGACGRPGEELGK